MEYYAVLGMIVAAIIAVAGFYATTKKNIKEELSPMEDLNTNLVKLNTNFENMLENDKIRDKRLEKHGQEIDTIKERQKENEKTLIKHDEKINYLEEKVKKEV